MMKKITLLTFLILTTVQFLRAQPMPQDGKSCCTPLPLVVPSMTIANTQGSGLVTDDVSCSCLNGEGGSTWFAFSVISSGFFEFKVETTGQPLPNFDWALWAGSCPCGGGGITPPNTAIACNSATGSGPTGVAHNPMATFGVPASAEFESSVFLEAGRNYFLLVSNQTNNGVGFTLDIAGTAGLWNFTPQSVGLNITGPTQVCTGGTATFTTTINQSPYTPTYEWSSVGPPNYLGVFNSSQTNPSKTITFDYPGTYTVCVRAYRNDLGCFPSALSCINVTVADLPSPAAYESGYVCTNDYYVASNGDVYYSGGIYDLHFQNQFGCDSLVRLTLEQKVSPFFVTVKEICPGECVTWGGQTYCDGGVYDDVQQSQFGCDSTNELIIVAVPLETKINGAAAINCNNSSVTLTSTGSIVAANPVYSWKKGNVTVGSGTTLNVTTGGTYTLTITSTVGGHTCSESASVTINQDTNPPQNVTATGGTANCSTAQVTLMGNSSTPGVTYSWTGPSGFTSNVQNPSVGVSGNYVLTVTGPNGCTKTATASVVITPPVSSQITNLTNVLCFGGSTGAATITPSGGNGVFSYAWSGGQTTATASNLSAGTYTVIVTDGNGCTSSQSVTINQPSTSLVVNASATPQLEFGVNNGTATADPTGGTGSYTYAWNNGQTTQTITGLAPGNYMVVVTDQNGCTASQTVTVAEINCNVKADIDQTNVSCPGAANGSATINLNDATPPFTFNWSNGATTQTVTGLSGGTYDVTATDVDGCDVVTTVIIEEPTTLHPNAIASNLTFYNANDGTATANPNGGTAPYTYDWSNGQTSQTINDLAPGTYTVVVTDANGCTATQTVNVTQFNCTLAATAVIGAISCNGENDGQLSFSTAGGTGPFTYEWSNGETTATITDLAAGTYTGTLTDANGCQVVSEIDLPEPTALGIAVVNMVEATCGSSNGSLTISGTGGTGTYTYLWQSGESTATITNLNAGTYPVAITDENGCTDNFEVVLGTDDDVLPVTLTQDITVALDADGQATITPADIDNGSTDNCSIANYSLDVTSFDCSNLGDNTVTLSVTDVGNNTVSATANVTVEDHIAPVLVLQDINVTVGTSGSVTITPQMLDNGSSDNCGIVTWTLSQETFGCDAGGDNSVEVTATDASGNSTTATAIVTVTGGSAGPEITCPANLSLPFCDPVADFDVTAVDNCGGDVVLTQDSGLPSGSSYPTGSTTVAYTATNVNGGASSCSFTVTVAAAMNVSTTPHNVTCFNEDDGSASTTITGGTQPYTYLWSNGQTTATATGLVQGQYTVTVTDADGCTKTQTVSITQPPSFSTALVEIVNSLGGQPNGSINVTVSGGVPPYTYVWKNSAGMIIGNTEDISNLAAGTYSLLATDANGCLSPSGYTVQNASATSETDLNSHVLLYPNPTSGDVTLELTGLILKQDVEVTAFDVTGRQVLSQTVSAAKQSLDFNSKPSGVYLVKIVVEGTTLTKRLVVSR